MTWRRALLIVASLGILAGGLVFALQGGAKRRVLPVAVPAFVDQAVGSQRSSTPTLHAGGVAATLDQSGFTTADGQGSVSLASTTTGASTWKHFQRGASRPNRFGYQTITRHNTVYIQYIPRTLRYAKTNLEKYPRFARLRELLATHVEELA